MLIHAISAYGLVVLSLAVGLESAGMPLPGEATLIAAAVLASQAQLDIVAVIVVAAIAAILGGTAAYIIGRTGARPVPLQWRLGWCSTEGWLSRAKRLFEAKAFPRPRMLPCRNEDRVHRRCPACRLNTEAVSDGKE